MAVSLVVSNDRSDEAYKQRVCFGLLDAEKQLYDQLIPPVIHSEETGRTIHDWGITKEQYCKVMLRVATFGQNIRSLNSQYLALANTSHSLREEVQQYTAVVSFSEDLQPRLQPILERLESQIAHNFTLLNNLVTRRNRIKENGVAFIKLFVDSMVQSEKTVRDQALYKLTNWFINNSLSFSF
jgi:hypothetical protein